MRKFPTSTFEDRPRSRRSRISLCLSLGFLALLLPVLYDSSRLCLASWRGLFGTYSPVQTPVLDALSTSYQTVSQDVRSWTRSTFHQTPWKTSYVIPFAIFWTVVLSLLLRKA